MESLGALMFVYVVMTISSYHESRRAGRVVPQWGVPRPVSLALALLWPVVIPWGVLLRHLFKWDIVKPSGPGVEYCFVGYCTVLVVILWVIT